MTTKDELTNDLRKIIDSLVLADAKTTLRKMEECDYPLEVCDAVAKETWNMNGTDNQAYVRLFNREFRWSATVEFFKRKLLREF